MSDTEGPTDEPPGRGDGDGAAHEEGRASSSGPEADPVGTVGEEAAKLLGALSEWARDQGTDYTGMAAGAASSFANAVRDVNEHIATDSAECRYCPVCQVIHVVRSTSPEVRANLSLAASSLMNAAAGLLATHTTNPSTSPVERIDLDESDGDWDEEP